MAKGSYESFGAYARLGRPLDEGSRKYVLDVFKLIADEMSDASTTNEMFVPYAKIVNFVLANRQIQSEVNNSSSSLSEG